MRKATVISLLIFLIGNFGNCKGILSKYKSFFGKKGSILLWPVGLSGNRSDSTSLPAPNTQISQPPTVEGLPDGLKPENISITESKTTPIPASINSSLVPIGKVYDVELDPNVKFKDEQGNIIDRGEGSLLFKEPVKLIYSYNKDLLKESGFTDEFFVYYYDKRLNKWSPVKSISNDPENSQVVAYTDHFTPFVLVAAPTVSGTTTPIAPACIAADFPSGIGGSGGARFMAVDISSTYYQDRNYKIDASSSQTINTFNNLGFRNALGISTCNGGSGAGSVTGINCLNSDTAAAHKFNTQTDYISFTAHTNLDVYLIHYDDSPAAPWIATKGFVDTGMKIDTTVIGTTAHKVYKKTYLMGDVIKLDGNWYGGASTNTNYFVILKRAGDVSNGYASNLCEKNPDITPPVSITNLKGIPGSDKALLQWENPINTDLTNVIIRQGSGSPPNTMSDGVAPNGSILNPNTFEITGLTVNTTYFFSVFSMDSNAKVVQSTISLKTGPDTDGDGLSDAFETTYFIPNQWTWPNRLDPSNVDTDGDGVDDRTELINGTNPMKYNLFKPIINGGGIYPNPTQYPIVDMNVNAISEKGVKGWMITKTASKPLASDSRWILVDPPQNISNSSFVGSGYQTKIQIIGGIGKYTYYTWAMDDGGVSDPQVFEVNYDGQKIPKYLYETNDLANTLGAYNIDLLTGNLSLFQTINYDPSGMPYGNRGPLEIAIHPNGKFVYVTDGSNLYTYSADIATGNLTQLDKQSFGNRPNDPTDSIIIHPQGKILYSFNSPSTLLRIYDLAANGKPNFKSNFTFSSFAYNYQNNYNNLIFKKNFSETTWVGLATYSPQSLFKNRIKLHPSGNYFEVNYLNAINTNSVSLAVADIPPSGYGTHIYPFETYNTGMLGDQISLKEQIFNGDGGILNYDNQTVSAILETIPNFGFGYSNYMPPALFTEGGSLVINYPSGDGSSYSVSRLHQCQIMAPITPMIRIAKVPPIYNNCSPLKSTNMQFDIGRIHMDPTGHFLYVPDNDDAHNGSHVLNAFSINQNTGDLTAINTDVVNSTSVFDVKVLDIHDYNDPPIVDIQRTTQEYQDIAANAPIFLNAINSYDPDATRCNADRSKYSYIWTVVAPPGSTLSSANIVNANSLNSAYFPAPDKTGDYYFTLAFKDDHGTCAGVDKTTFNNFTVKVRRILRYPEATGAPTTVVIGGQTMTIPYTGATVQTDPKKPSNIIKWVQVYQTGGDMIEYGIYTRTGIYCDMRVPVPICIPVDVCTMTNYTFDQSVALCNKSPIAYLWQSWTPTRKEYTTVVSHGYWTYWSE